MRRLSLLLLIALTSGRADLSASEFVARRAAIVSGSPQATQAGVGVLQSGGNAIDAAIAASMVSSYVTPENGGLGGGGFLLYFEHSSGGVWILDFRETAPAAATRAMFLLPDGTVHPDHQRGGPITVAVPGTLMGLEVAHRRFGKAKWSDLVAPAIAVAREHMIAPQSLAIIEEQRVKRSFSRYPTTTARFFEGRTPSNGPAAFLEKVATRGAAELYTGITGKKLADLLSKSGSALSAHDLRVYRPIWRSPVTVGVGNFTVVSAPPPSTSGIGLAQTLQILSSFDVRATGRGTAASFHIFAEAERRAAADRAEFLGDPDQTRIPFREILSNDYIAAKRSTIDPQHATPGRGADISPEAGAASHVIVNDAEGNVAIISTSLGAAAGSGIWFPEGGFFLNSAMTDFTVRPDGASTEGRPAANANAIAPGKRMLSSLAPVILLNGGKPLIAVAAGEGSAVSTAVQILYGVAIYGESLSDSIDAPHVGFNKDGSGLSLTGTPAAEVVEALRGLGHTVDPSPARSSACGLWFTADGIRAVTSSDSRGAAGGY